MNTDFKLYAVHAGRFYSSLPIKHQDGDWIPAGGYRCRAQLFQNVRGTWVIHRLALMTANRYLDIPWFGSKRKGRGLMEHMRLVPEFDIVDFDGGEFGPCWTTILKPGYELATSERDAQGRLLPCQAYINCACGVNHTGPHMTKGGYLLGNIRDQSMLEEGRLS